MLIKLSKARLTYLPNTPFEAVALNDVSFSLNPEEAVGIAGPIGSGKSTFGQVMAGLLKPDSGDLSVGGKKVPEELSASQVFRFVSFLFQKPEKQLFEANVYDEVAFGPWNLGLDNSLVDQAVKQALDIVGLDFDVYKTRSPFNLSGGEMRRTGLASVLAIDASALILDEPTAGLDASGRRQIINYLKNVKSHKKSIVLISHDLGEILEVCDRLIVLDKGKIVLSTHTEDIDSHSSFLEKLGLYLPDDYILASKLKECGYQIDHYDKAGIEKAIEQRLS